MEERLEAAERMRQQQQTRNPLEPLLLKLATEFSDSQDLSTMLQKLYQASAAPGPPRRWPGPDP